MADAAGVAAVVRSVGAAAMVAGALALHGCATPTFEPSSPRGPAMSVEQARAHIAGLLPAEVVADRGGWATDIYAAMRALEIPASAENVCAIVAVTAQESGFRVDPPVPGLPAIAKKEIERQRERAGIPKLVLDTALAMQSSTGKTYAERLDAVRTEHELSQIFEDFIGRVPLGTTFFGDRNPVRTGGPMQVSIAFAEAHAAATPYPYAVKDSIRREVFTRRGGMYFGIAHLLDYPAGYDRPLYRFADYNAGHYASRNAAFQRAVTEASGIPLALDGDVLRYESGRPAREPGNTELALRTLGKRLDMSDADIRDDLEAGSRSPSARRDARSRARSCRALRFAARRSRGT